MATARAKRRPVVTPTVLQMEAAECGAAALGIVLGAHGKFVLLEELRDECAVSRDGTKASNIISAAQRYGLIAKGWAKGVEDLGDVPLPAIIHWNFAHFLVLEGLDAKHAWLNDPASGRRRVSIDELSASFTGVVLTFEPGPELQRGGRRHAMLPAVLRRVQGVEGLLAFLLLASLLLVLPGLALPTMARTFVDDVLIQGKDDWLRPLLLGMGLTALARAVLTWMKERYLVRAYNRLAVISSARFLWHLLELPVQFFLARFPGEIGSRIGLNDKVANLLSGRLAASGLDLLMIVFYAALLASYDVGLTLIGVGIAALNLAALRYLARRRTDQSQRLQQESGKLVGVSMGALQIIETLKASGTEADFFAKWAGHYAKVQNAARELEVSTLYLASIPALLSALGSAAVLAVGGLRVIDGAMTVGMLVAFQSLLASFLQPVHSLMELGSTLQETEADLKRLDDVTEHQTTRKKAAIAEAATIDLGGPPTGRRKLAGWVELERVTFGYVRQAKPLLTELSLDLRPGSRVALVGGSGSGKSTVARLVAGLYDAWDGRIRFDGLSRSSHEPATLHSSIAMVDQEISLFEGTVRENITLWDPSIPEARVIQAAKDAQIHDDIMARPGGYDGKVDEGGRNFSGGQRQRLEIARALARDPTVLLLDEATSALDPPTERLIDQNLRRRGCTCLIVAHRLSTIRDADEILVLDGGVVVERGTHHQLMEANGHYARLMGSA